MIVIVYILIGYLFGCIQTGYIISKFYKGIDLRQHGSGNLGTTNAIRVMGKKLGLLTFIGDFSKAIIAFMLVKYLLEAGDVGGLYAGIGSVLGHNFPFYLNFKGGKGIAVTGGVMLCVNPIATIIIIAGMLLIILVTRYVSLASITAMLAMSVWAGFMFRNDIEMMLLTFFLAALAIFMHRSNIKRLINGTENKFGTKKKVED